MTKDPAFKFFLTMQLGRFAGVAFVIAGLMAIQRQIDLPEWTGYPLVIVGMATFFLVPRYLARKWRSRGE